MQHSHSRHKKITSNLLRIHLKGKLRYTTRGSYVHKPMVQFWGASWFFLLSQNIDGYRQNDSQDLYFLVLHITVVIRLDQGAKCSLLLCIFLTPTDKNLAKFPSRIHLRVALVFATLAAKPTRNAEEEEVVAAHEGCQKKKLVTGTQ